MPSEIDISMDGMKSYQCPPTREDEALADAGFRGG